MENEEKLPKPQTDLPLPEKEIPEYLASKGDAFRSYRRYLIFGIGAILFLSIIGGAYFLGRNSVLKEFNPTAPSIPPPDEPSYQTPTPDLYTEATRSATADWKTYTNTQFGISFKYPTDWKITDPYLGSPDPSSRTGLIPSNKTQDSSTTPIYTLFFDNPNNLSLQKWEEERDKQGGMSRHFYSANAQPTTVAGYTAYVEDDHGCEPYLCKQVVIMETNKIIVFYNLKDENSYSETELNSYQETFDQILSTFKFTQ